MKPSKQAQISLWLTTTEAGRLLGFSGATIRNMCDDGRLSHIKPCGEHRRIPRSAVEAMLAKLGHTPEPDPTPVPPSPALRARKPSTFAAELEAKLRRLRRAEQC